MPDIATADHIDESVSSVLQNTSSANKEVPDHYALKKGVIDHELNKIVEEIILNTDNFVVYIASDYSVQWRTADSHVSSEHQGEILNQVALLEAQTQFITDNDARRIIKCQIAEGLARCLDGYDKENSLAILREVELQLKARNKETSWKWYFKSAYVLTLACLAAFALLWVFRDQAKYVVGATAHEVILGALCGAFGALLSVTARGNRLVLDANAGKNIHKLEGLSRIGAGLIGALFVALGIKSGLIMGGVQFSGSKLSLLLAFCIVAGASERLVPSLVENFEKTALSIGDKTHNSR